MARGMRERWLTISRPAMGLVLALGLLALPAYAASAVSTEYMQQFAQQGRAVFVMEYLDAAGSATLTRRVEPLTSFDLTSTVRRRYNQTHIRSYGIVPCPKATIRFGGAIVDCPTMSVQLVRQGIENAVVILCRAFAVEDMKPEQQANCYELNRHTRRATSTDEAIVFLGLGDLELDRSGKPRRPDLQRSHEEANQQRLGLHGID